MKSLAKRKQLHMFHVVGNQEQKGLCLSQGHHSRRSIPVSPAEVNSKEGVVDTSVRSGPLQPFVGAKAALSLLRTMVHQLFA